MRDPVYAVRLHWADGFTGTMHFLTPRLLVRHLLRIHGYGETFTVVGVWEES